MRELDRMKIVNPENVRAYIGLDQDPLSVEIAQQRLSPLGGNVEKLSVTSLLRHRISRNKFDLIYASGIFDYLKDDLARSLASALVDFLAVGGKLIIANFTPTNAGRAYMEAVMDWNLIYRSEKELADLMPRLPSAFDTSFTSDTNGNIAYFETVRLK
jgi:SAM-dependent methyltransferase